MNKKAEVTPLTQHQCGIHRWRELEEGVLMDLSKFRVIILHLTLCFSLVGFERVKDLRPRRS